VWWPVCPEFPNKPTKSSTNSSAAKPVSSPVAFLLHLLHPRSVPIIDQHNFRAVNALLAAVRPEWKGRSRPTMYGDIALVGTFMDAVLRAWSRHAPTTVPKPLDLDKFLMMYGKSIKRQHSSRRTRN
jgi:hypothetical protein